MNKKSKNVAVIGAGFTGLAAAHRLAKLDYKVTVFESSALPGGLALGFRDKGWQWSLECHYHHLFATDKAINSLAREVGQRIKYLRPKTSTYYNGDIQQIDSPRCLLTFSHLSVLNRLRTGIILLFLKLTPTWRLMEKVTVRKFIVKAMGRKSWEVLWKPLMEKKFGKYSNQIPASWFWARVKSRTASLGYPEKGFLYFAQVVAKEVKKSNGTFFYSESIIRMRRKDGKVLVSTSLGKDYWFDLVVCTLPTPLFLKITQNLPRQYKKKIKKLVGIGAENLVLSLKEGFLPDRTYWLNVNDRSFPFLAIVEHTNFMRRDRYHNQHIIYVGSYLHNSHKQFRLNQEDLLEKYLPYLKKINPKFDKDWITSAWLFKASFAQPIVFKNYSKHVPDIKTPLEGIYLANMQQVYPWDRGTNYAVELGEKVARLVDRENRKL